MSAAPQEPLEIDVPHPAVRRVAAVFQRPPGRLRGRPILLAHGAGADMHSDFLAAMARGLAGLGFPVLRFRYPYMQRISSEGRRRPPDPAPLLEAAHAAALEELVRRVPGARPLLAGKSLGGRMGTHLAAKGADVSGLVLLGYPLHPAGRPERERSEHFPAIVQPALFVQGTRDKLCDLARLRRALEGYGGAPTLAIVESADHSFQLPARCGRSAMEVREEIVAKIGAWERAAFPS